MTTEAHTTVCLSVSHQQAHEEPWLLLTLAVSCRACELLPTPDDGSASKLSDILSQMMSTNRSNTAFTFTLSFADVSKNSKPRMYQPQTHAVKLLIQAHDFYTLTWLVLKTLLLTIKFLSRCHEHAIQKKTNFSANNNTTNNNNKYTIKHV